MGREFNSIRESAELVEVNPQAETSALTAIRNPNPAIRNQALIAGVVGAGWLLSVVGLWLTRPAVAIAAGQDFGRAGELVVLEPEKWVGERFSLAEHIDVGSQLTNGSWTVLLVHHDCEHCADAVAREVRGRGWGVVSREENSIPNSQSDIRNRLAVIEIPPCPTPDRPALWSLPQGVLAGKLDESRDWFASTPVTLDVRDGTITAARDATITQATTAAK